MMDSSDGELGIGLQDIRKHPDGTGLQQRIKDDQTYLELRLTAAYFALVLMLTFFTWTFNFSANLRYGSSALAILSILIFILLKIRRHFRIEKIRAQQLHSHRQSKKPQSTTTNKDH